MNTGMRRFARIAISLSGLLLLLGYFWYSASTIARGDITAAFASDIADYVAFHDGILPRDWAQFTDWMKSTRSSDRWSAAELQSRFTIQFPRIQEQAAPPVYIRVVDTKLSTMQDFINRSIHNSQYR